MRNEMSRFPPNRTCQQDEKKFKNAIEEPLRLINPKWEVNAWHEDWPLQPFGPLHSPQIRSAGSKQTKKKNKKEKFCKLSYCCLNAVGAYKKGWLGWRAGEEGVVLGEPSDEKFSSFAFGRAFVYPVSTMLYGEVCMRIGMRTAFVGGVREATSFWKRAGGSKMRKKCVKLRIVKWNLWATARFWFSAFIWVDFGPAGGGGAA